MSCFIWNELLYHMCEPCNISKPFSPSWHELLTQVYLWTNYLCISLKHILVHLRLSLNYQNQTRTFQEDLWANRSCDCRAARIFFAGDEWWIYKIIMASRYRGLPNLVEAILIDSREVLGFPRIFPESEIGSAVAIWAIWVSIILLKLNWFLTDEDRFPSFVFMFSTIFSLYESLLVIFLLIFVWSKTRSFKEGYFEL